MNTQQKESEIMRKSARDMAYAFGLLFAIIACSVLAPHAGKWGYLGIELVALILVNIWFWTANSQSLLMLKLHHKEIELKITENLNQKLLERIEEIEKEKTEN